MNMLVELMNELIVKYNMEEADVVALQEVLSTIESDGMSEFDYMSDTIEPDGTETVVEEQIV